MKNQVYVLMEVYNMSDCVDLNGEDAGDQEIIKGIFKKKEKAEKTKLELERENAECESDSDCDPIWYRIDPWEVQ